MVPLPLSLNLHHRGSRGAASGAGLGAGGRGGAKSLGIANEEAERNGQQAHPCAITTRSPALERMSCPTTCTRSPASATAGQTHAFPARSLPWLHALGLHRSAKVGAAYFEGEGRAWSRSTTIAGNWRRTGRATQRPPGTLAPPPSSAAGPPRQRAVIGSQPHQGRRARQGTGHRGGTCGERGERYGEAGRELHLAARDIDI